MNKRINLFIISALFFLLLVSSVSAIEASIRPSPATDDDRLTCYVDGVSGTSLTGSYHFKWLKNGVDSGRTGATVPATQTGVGDRWACRVYDLDWDYLGVQASATIRANNEPDTTPIVELRWPTDGLTFEERPSVTFSFDVDNIEEHDSMNRYYLAAYSAFTGAPAVIIYNKQGAVEEAVAKLGNLLKSSAPS